MTNCRQHLLSMLVCLIGAAMAFGVGCADADSSPQANACRLMPLGDSITDGYQSSTGAGYRLELFRTSLTNAKKLTFVGSGQNGPNTVNDTPFPRHHEGHSGWTIDEGNGRSGLYPKVEGWLQAATPHIVTLMIGTNDIGVQLDLANAPKHKTAYMKDGLHPNDAGYAAMAEVWWPAVRDLLP